MPTACARPRSSTPLGGELNPNLNPMRNLSHYLPQSLEFYDASTIRQSPSELILGHPLEIDSDLQGVGFELFGERPAWILFLIPEGADLSEYTELGNLISSRLALDYSEAEDVPSLISPPRALSARDLDLFFRPGAQMEHRRFARTFVDGRQCTLDCLIIAKPAWVGSTGEIARA